MFDVQIVHSVQEIGQEAWDRLAGGRSFASYRWYRWGETVLGDELPLYVILSQYGESVARATFWLKKREPLPLQSTVWRRLIGAMLRRWPLLMCESPLALTSGLILPDSPLGDTALETIARVALDLAQHYAASFVVFPYLERHEAERMAWPDVFGSTVFSDPGTQLAIVWSDFDEYVKQLNKKMRRHYRRTNQKAAELGIEVKRHAAVTRLEEALVLIQNLYERHNSPPNPLIRKILESADMVDATWLTAEVDGRMVGCELIIGDGETRFLAALGLDYDVKYVYFKLGYEDVRCAIEEGIRVLRGGGSAYDEKRRMGFQLESNNHVVFAGRGALLQRLGRWAAAGNTWGETNS